MQKHYFSLIIGIVFLIFCKKDQTDQSFKKCIIDKVITESNNGIIELDYEYTSQAELTRINEVWNSRLSSYQIYKYNIDGTVARINKYNAAGTLFEYVTYDYNSEKLPIKYSFYELHNSFNNLQLSIVVDYEYNLANQLIRSNKYDLNNSDGLLHYVTYSYDQKGNINKTSTFFRDEQTEDF